jgi:hypothetical protein
MADLDSGKCVDIGGLDDLISSIKETVIYPLVYPELFRSASYWHFPALVFDISGDSYLLREASYSMARLVAERQCSQRLWPLNRTTLPPSSLPTDLIHTGEPLSSIFT